MPQFMDRFLEHPPLEPVSAIGPPGFGGQTVARNDAGFAAELGFSVDVSQDGDEQIHLHQRDDFQRPFRRGVSEPPEDRRRVVLLARGIIGEGEIDGQRVQGRRATENGLNRCGDRRGEFPGEVAAGHDQNRMSGCGRQASFRSW